MKKLPFVIAGIIFFLLQDTFAQLSRENTNTPKFNKSVFFSAGFNTSYPIHDDMIVTHRFGIGVNARVFRKIAPRTELGLRFDYNYRFIKTGTKKLITPESTLAEKSAHSNFSIFCLKPNIQFNLKRNWYLGLEAGVGYALSDADPEIGLAFVSEFNGSGNIGACTGLYLGKYLFLGQKKHKMGISLNFNQYINHGHAESNMALKCNYIFKKNHSY